jgi:hypothetical protein
MARQEYFSGVPTILVCDAFWGQSNAEQATTILHELTHFAGTDDSVQGEGRAGALALAAADPNAAARSAYNYEFFFGDLGF